MMPKLGRSWSAQGEGEKEKEHTEGLKTNYGKCQPAGTESATLHGGLGNT
jgi:hypothetical protein